jgi:hypothetical protein
MIYGTNINIIIMFGLSFCNTWLYLTFSYYVLAAARTHFPAATDKEMETHVRNFLKNSKWRMGGSGKPGQ